ncbi:universal stress protein [Minwuia sp.]|uniref:universal stress protein n=1 Tax=Minwuia sp. TaxID=2493630 RepID=UPI003A8FADE3
MNQQHEAGHAKRILACIDASAYATSVSDLAAWAADRLSASVEVLHVVQRKDAVAARKDLSGAIGLGVKSDLLEELTRIDEAEARLAIERGRLLLDASVKRLRDAGIAEVMPLHRHGGIVETIIEREQDSVVVVIGKRGASGEFAADHLGSKVERVVRSSAKPVIVAPLAFRPPDTAVIAYDGSALSLKAIEIVASSDLFDGMAVHLVSAGPDHASQRSKLEQAAARLTGRRGEIVTKMLDGQADRAIRDYVADLPAGMLVMGAYGHSPLRRLIVGSTTTTMIRTVDAPILLIR